MPNKDSKEEPQTSIHIFMSASGGVSINAKGSETDMNLMLVTAFRGSPNFKQLVENALGVSNSIAEIMDVTNAN